MSKLDDEIDALFQLPLGEFIGARKTLAAQLKKDGRADDAERVKLLAKPSISAWAANQLYWQHRQAFDRLIASGQRFHKAQKSGKVTDMRDALDARRKELSHLSDLATTLLGEAGHNPSLDTIRRVTTTLEGVSAASISDGPTPGRLTQDVDPPGFESFGSFVPSAGTTKRTEKPIEVRPAKKSGDAGPKARQEATQASEARRLEASRQARIIAAKVSLQNAKKTLASVRAKAQSLEATKKKLDAVAKEAEKNRRDAEERFKKAKTAAEDTAERAESLKAELEETTSALEDAKRSVERETRELERLFREKP
ncbi:MAG TPA: hypothetical protein VJU86_10325 [Pyrinomonadaceae bacterium]|nr:hypothetical protein [Pyrinomonadaceae bacterium]